MKALSLLFLLPGLGHAQTAVDDARVAGSLGVGTASPAARVEVKASSATQTPFQVSGVDLSPMFSVDRTGKVGLGTAPAANLDVFGVDVASGSALALGAGNLYPASGSHQIAFGYNNLASHRHAIRTRHADSSENNSIDFLVWTPAAGASSIATMQVLSLVTASTGASVHVRPAGTPAYELEVSDASSIGAGTVHRASEGQHSSLRELKTDIRYLAPEDEGRALEDVLALRHARFKYKAKGGRELVGLIYEDAPESIRAGRDSIAVDARLVNAELAAKELLRRLESAQREAGALE